MSRRLSGKRGMGRLGDWTLLLLWLLLLTLWHRRLLEVLWCWDREVLRGGLTALRRHFVSNGRALLGDDLLVSGRTLKALALALRTLGTLQRTSLMEDLLLVVLRHTLWRNSLRRTLWRDILTTIRLVQSRRSLALGNSLTLRLRLLLTLSALC